MKTKRGKKLKIFTSNKIIADGIEAKLNLMECNHYKRNLNGVFVFTPTRTHKRKFEKLLPWLRSMGADLRHVRFNLN